MKSLQQFSMVLAMVLACAGLAGALASGFGVRFGFWEFRSGFTILRWSVYAAAAAVILAILGFALAKFSGMPMWNPWTALALLIGLVIFAVPYFIVKDFRKTPTIADATTNMTDPPVFVALVPIREGTAKNPLAYRRDEAAALQTQYFSDLKSIESSKSPAEVVAAAKVAAKKLGLEIVDAASDAGRLEATATTFWFGFKDDVVLRAHRQPNGKTLIDIRSASRVGRLDGGVNARRIQRLLQELRESR